jgi:hypothetical protein
MLKYRDPLVLRILLNFERRGSTKLAGDTCRPRTSIVELLKQLDLCDIGLWDMSACTR